MALVIRRGNRLEEGIAEDHVALSRIRKGNSTAIAALVHVVAVEACVPGRHGRTYLPDLAEHITHSTASLLIRSLEVLVHARCLPLSGFVLSCSGQFAAPVHGVCDYVSTIAITTGNGALEVGVR